MRARAQIRYQFYLIFDPLASVFQMACVWFAHTLAYVAVNTLGSAFQLCILLKIIIIFLYKNQCVLFVW
jgi:hypothetical protein